MRPEIETVCFLELLVEEEELALIFRKQLESKHCDEWEVHYGLELEGLAVRDDLLLELEVGVVGAQGHRHVVVHIFQVFGLDEPVVYPKLKNIEVGIKVPSVMCLDLISSFDDSIIFNLYQKFTCLEISKPYGISCFTLTVV